MIPMKRFMLILILWLMALPLAGKEVWAEETGPCDEDMRKFCSDVKAGGGRLVNCLKEHEQELSAACKEQQAVLQRKNRKIFQECQDDVERFCKDVRPVDRRIIRCLLQNEAALSSECKEKLKVEK
jgi:hypothetical protein